MITIGAALIGGLIALAGVYLQDNRESKREKINKRREYLISRLDFLLPIYSKVLTEMSASGPFLSQQSAEQFMLFLATTRTLNVEGWDAVRINKKIAKGFGAEPDGSFQAPQMMFEIIEAISKEIESLS